MHKCLPLLLVCFSVCLPACKAEQPAPPPAPEPEPAVEFDQKRFDKARVQNSFLHSRVGYLLDTVPADQRDAYLTRMAKEMLALEAHGERMSQITEDMHTAFLNQFNQTAVLPAPTYAAAPRSKPLAEDLPAELTLTQTNGRTRAQYAGQKPLHLCINHPLQRGAALVIRVRIQSRGGTRNTPVPYMGVRTASGSEATVANFGSAPGTHEVYVYLSEDQAISTKSNSQVVQSKRIRPGETYYPFIHLNRTADVVIEQVRVLKTDQDESE